MMSNLSKVLALNSFACESSDYYYFGKGVVSSKSYWNQPYEIAAQYAGIRSAYSFLEMQYGSKDANHMICDYQNYRVSTGYSFVRRLLPYHDVSDILSDLNRKFQKCANIHRNYDVSELLELPYGPSNSVFQYASFRQNSYYTNCMQYCPYGLKQDSMLIASHLRVSGERQFLKQPVFRDLDLDVDIVFQPNEKPIVPMPNVRDLQLSDLLDKTVSGLNELDDNFEKL